MRKKLHLITLACGLAALSLAGTALAVESGEVAEQDLLAHSKITLSQAIATAEGRTGGKAYDAGVQVDQGKPRLAIETNGPNGVQTVIIDADTGQVVGTHAGGEAD
jgi:uncharacterized membrane protein YkoI